MTPPAANIAEPGAPRAVPAPAVRKALPPRYFLDHFTQVIDGVRGRYGWLLTDAELQYLATLQALPEPARMLYARLVNRRGPCFRLDRLSYPEIASLDQPVAALLAAGLLEPCDETLDPELHHRLFACFTHAELRAELRHHGLSKLTRKPELLAGLAGWDAGATWLAALLRKHAMIRIAAADPWPFLRFLFFGDLRANLADFVTNALGHVVTEGIAECRLVAQFTSRIEAEDAYRMATLYVEFRRIRDAQPVLATHAWWQAQAIDRRSLAAGAAWFDRLVDRLGRLLEREGQWAAARALYETSPAAPARQRLARLLIKSGEKEAAMGLLQEMRDAPCHAEEAYAARQLLGRLDKTARRSKARAFQRISQSLVLAYPDGGVEAAVLAHYRMQGWNGVHAENWLWNASFGLLLWDIIYDPSLGTFHSPLQMAPSDLHELGFYARRQPRIEERLALLAEPDAALALMRRHLLAKNGIANPFVYWHAELLPVLEIMLRRLPPAGHAAALRHLAQDVRRHSRGLPDLFIWNAADYRFIEIKAENDHLAAHQYAWLQVLSQAGIEVSLEKIARPAPCHAAVASAAT